jgi:hypothetical protein
MRSGRRFGFLMAVAVTVIAAMPGMAAAFGNPLEEGMQTLYNPDGSGRLFAGGGYTAKGALSTTWERCKEDLSACEVVGTQDISTGSAPAGTVFRLQGAASGPTWHGNLSVLAPPSVQGVLSADELVTPVPARWQGGWEGSSDATQLAACRTATGEDCVSISDPAYVDGCGSSHQEVLLDPSFVGDYLRVADTRDGPGSVSSLIAYTSPYGHPIWPAAGDTAVAMVGQIGPATHPRAATCGPSPLVEAWISSRGVAKVSCPLGCAAVLVGRHGRRTSRSVLQIPSSGAVSPPRTSGTEPSGSTLKLSRGALKWLGRGPADFTVEVGGQAFAEKTVTPAPRPKHRHRHRHAHPKHGK